MPSPSKDFLSCLLTSVRTARSSAYHCARWVALVLVNPELGSVGTVYLSRFLRSTSLFSLALISSDLTCESPSKPILRWTDRTGHIVAGYMQSRDNLLQGLCTHHCVPLIRKGLPCKYRPWSRASNARKGHDVFLAERIAQQRRYTDAYTDVAVLVRNVRIVRRNRYPLDTPPLTLA